MKDYEMKIHKFLCNLVFSLMVSVSLSLAEVDVLPEADASAHDDEALEKAAIVEFAPAPEGLRIAVGVGLMSGETTFDIGGNVALADGTVERLRFPLSKLEYPLDVTMASIAATYDFADRWQVLGSLGKNLTSDSGKTKDSDWGIFFSPNSLDIYSESDTEMDAMLLDFGLRYRLRQTRRGSLKVGVGYAWQQFDAKVSNLVQTYPSLVWAGARPDIVDGPVSEYDVTYSMPYLEVAASYRLKENLTIDTRLGYSPSVSAEDNGNWLLRDKTLKGDCDGDATFFSLQGRMDFDNQWFAALRLEMNTISTDGKQKQYFHGEYFGEIDQKIESEQQQFMVMIGKVF